MLNKKLVLEYLVNTTQNALKSESIKQKLNNNERCEPYAIFSRIDREDKGYLIKDDFIRFLNENNVNIEKQRNTVDLFIEYYDRDFDEKINFTEFLNFVLNKEQNLSRSISSQRETYKISSNEYLDKDLEKLTTEALMTDFYLFEYADMKKIDIFMHFDQSCDEREDCKLINLFLDIDVDQDGMISCDDLFDFVTKRKIKICKNELQSFIGLFDEDMDGFLDWNEFLFMILPSSSSFEYDLNSLQRQEQKYLEFYSNINNHKSINYRDNNNFCSSNNNDNNHDYNFCYNYAYNFENNQRQITSQIKNIPNGNALNNSNNFNNLYNNSSKYDTNNYNLNSNSSVSNININTRIPSQNYYNNSYNIQTYQDNCIPSVNNQFQDLCQIFHQIIGFEKVIDSLKCKLISDKNFNLSNLFDYFDRYNNGYISFVDFQEGLESLNINNKNSLLLFSKYDKSNIGRLNKENFLSIFLSSNSNTNDFLNNKSFQFDNNYFENVIKPILNELLNNLISYVTFLNELLKIYEERKINIDYLFGILDKNNKGYIEEDEFQQIFKFGNGGKNEDVNDLLLIMEVIDSDKDGRITKHDLIDLFKNNK